MIGMVSHQARSHLRSKKTHQLIILCLMTSFTRNQLSYLLYEGYHFKMKNYLKGLCYTLNRRECFRLGSFRKHCMCPNIYQVLYLSTFSQLGKWLAQSLSCCFWEAFRLSHRSLLQQDLYTTLSIHLALRQPMVIIFHIDFSSQVNRNLL